MKWFLSVFTAAVFGLMTYQAAAACGCCGCCAGGGNNNKSCPNCPQQAAGAGNSCPNCPQQAASSVANRYWSSAYGCYLFYDPATRASYFWSEPHRAYFPVRDQSQPGLGTAPVNAVAPPPAYVGDPGPSNPVVPQSSSTSYRGPSPVLTPMLR